MRITPFLLACCLYFFVVAVPVPAQPQVPEDYNYALVSKMVANVSKGSNAPLLKAFFASHRRHSVSQMEALDLLEGQVKKEVRGSNPWFILQGIRAFGSFHTSKPLAAQSVKIYSVVFDESHKIKDVRSRPYIKNIVYDFVSYVPSPYLNGNRESLNPGNSSLDLVLNKSIKTYYLLGSPGGIWEPDWWKAISYTSSDVSPYMKLVQDALKDRNIKKNKNFYRISALILTVSNTASNEKAEKLAAQMKEKSNKLG